MATRLSGPTSQRAWTSSQGPHSEREWRSIPGLRIASRTIFPTKRGRCIQAPASRLPHAGKGKGCNPCNLRPGFLCSSLLCLLATNKDLATKSFCARGLAHGAGLFLVEGGILVGPGNIFPTPRNAQGRPLEFLPKHPVATSCFPLASTTQGQWRRLVSPFLEGACLKKQVKDKTNSMVRGVFTRSATQNKYQTRVFFFSPMVSHTWQDLAGGVAGADLRRADAWSLACL